MGSIVTSAVTKGLRGRRRWWLLAGVAGAALLVVARFLPDTAPESDYAIIDLSVLNVLHGAQPVGMYSRFGWHHPGPLYFQLLSPAYWLSGYRHFSVNLTVIAINVACVAGIIAILRRQTSAAALLIAASLFGGAYLAGALMLFASPWTPHVVLLPLAFMIVASAMVAGGNLRWLPLVALTATFVVQTHVGPSLSVIVVTTIATLLGVVRAKSRRAPLLLTVVVLAAAWALPLIDEWRPNGLHNLRALAQFFQHSHGGSAADAIYAFKYFLIAPFSPQLGLSWGPTTPLPHAWVSTLAIVLLLCVIVTTLRSFFKRQTFPAMLGLLTIAGIGAAYISVLRLPEIPKDYTVMWIAIPGVLSWTLVAAAIVDAIGIRSIDRRLATVAIALLAVTVAVHVVVRRVRDQRIAPHIDVVTEAADEAIRNVNATTVLVQMPESLWGRAAGVVLHLAREGKSPRVDPDWVSMFGPQYASTGDEPAEISFVDADDQPLLQHRTDQRLLTKTSNLLVYFRSSPAHFRVASPTPSFEMSRETVGDLAAGLIFIGPNAFAQFSVPQVSATGVRLRGQGGTRWRFSCTRDESAFEEIGGAAIASGEGTRTADAFFDNLSGCRQLRIFSTSASVTQRLNGFQLLTR